MKILIVLTSHDTLGDTGHKTGFWLEELAAPYYVFKEAGADLTLASPMGGQAPLDPKSAEEMFQTEHTKRFEEDAEATVALHNTLKLADIAVSDFDAVFYPGGHGPLWDLAESADSIGLIESAVKHNKPLGLVCHAPAALKNVKAANGDPLVKNKSVTGFSNEEEDAVELTDVVPFLVQDMLAKNGASYSKGENWSPYVVQDGLLVTGQNPASSILTAQKLLQAL